MIEGYIGRPGSGKSYTLTERALREANRGRQVFTNYGLIHDNVFTFTPDQLLDLPPGLIVIDEAHVWFPARMGLRRPHSGVGMPHQTRKKWGDCVGCARRERARPGVWGRGSRARGGGARAGARAVGWGGSPPP